MGLCEHSRVLPEFYSSSFRTTITYTTVYLYEQVSTLDIIPFIEW